MTQMQPYRRIRTEESKLSEVQDSIHDSIVSIQPNSFLVGETIDVFLATGSTQEVNHKLGKKPEGWFVLDIDAPAVIYRDTTKIKLLDRILYLVTDVDVNLKIWVF
jgi:hypothetical protein